MITFLIPVKNREITKEFLNGFKRFSGNVTLMIGSCKPIKLKSPAKNIVIENYLFDEKASEEDIIETLTPKVYASSLVIIRDGQKDVNFEIVEKMILKQQTGYDVVLAKNNKKKNIFARFFSSILKKFVKHVFGFSFYDGELGIQVFGSNAISIMKISGTPNLTKINRWIGINIGYLETSISPCEFESKQRKSINFFTALYSIIFAVLLSATITVGILVTIPWLAILGIIFALLIAFVFSTFYVLKAYTVNKVGDLFGKKVEILKTSEVTK